MIVQIVILAIYPSLCDEKPVLTKLSIIYQDKKINTDPEAFGLYVTKFSIMFYIIISKSNC